MAKAQTAGNRRGASLCHHALGAVYYQTGNWRESQQAYHQSISLAREVGGAFGEILGSQRLALLETKLGFYDTAHRRLTRVMDMARGSESAMVNVHSMTRILGTLAVNRLEAGDLTRATGYLAEGWAAQQQFGECVPCDVLLYPAAVPIYVALGDLDQADWACSKAEEIASNFGSNVWSATARYLRGILLAESGDPNRAIDSFRHALAAFEEIGQPYDVARTLESLADVGISSDLDVGSPAPGSMIQRAATIYSTLGASPDERRAIANLNALR